METLPPLPPDAPLALQRVSRALERDPRFNEAMVASRLLPPEAERLSPLPASLAPALRDALHREGLVTLYSHQADAIAAALQGHDVLQLTPTSSGKSLGYLLPVLDELIKRPDSRALFLFPTKALAQDQLAAVRRLADGAGVRSLIEVYDGDTPPGLRRATQLGGSVILTNPDMLHAALLPHHARWTKFLSNLAFVVIDELHVYRGVFGSHVANVLRRLFRLAAHYGSRPTLLMASATVGNPQELAFRLTGRDPVLVDRSGAPMAARLVAVLNPPSPTLGASARPSPFSLSVHVASRALAEGVPTILFVKSRKAVEMAYRRLQALAPGVPVAPYRGGYLPNERRRVERGLRTGEIRGVVTTNALELGVDIGSLDMAVLSGFPPTVASTWQQMGRAGRRQTPAMAVIVAGPEPRDQFLARHPDLFFGAPIEAALLNPDNLHVLVDHVKASAFELPFRPEEAFGDQVDLATLLAFLEDGGVLRHAGERFFYAGAGFPAHDISLRTGGSSNVVIVDVQAGGRPIGEVDRPSAPTLVHDEAIYLHMGKTYEVLKLDLEENKAYVRPTEAAYVTDANLAVGVHVLKEDASTGEHALRVGLGDLKLTWLATIFKKIHLETGENLGWGRIQLPEDTMHTRGVWFVLDAAAFHALPAERRPDALSGLGHALHGLVPLLTMTAPQDTGVATEIRSPFTLRPTITLYDRVPGGIGIAEQTHRQWDRLLTMARDLVLECACANGCPSCVGAEGRKPDVVSLLGALP